LFVLRTGSADVQSIAQSQLATQVLRYTQVCKYKGTQTDTGAHPLFQRGKRKNPAPNAIYNCNNCEQTRAFSLARGFPHPPVTCVNISEHQKTLVADFNANFPARFLPDYVMAWPALHSENLNGTAVP